MSEELRHDSEEARLILEDDMSGSFKYLVVTASYLAILQDVLREHIIDDEKLLLRLRKSTVGRYALPLKL